MKIPIWRLDILACQRTGRRRLIVHEVAPERVAFELNPEGLWPASGWTHVENQAMKIMVIRPHEGIDALRFGMDRAAVARALGMTPKRVKPSEYSLELDSFESLGVFVMYDAKGLCCAVSVSRNCGTDWEYDGYRLLAHPAREVREWARSRDPKLESEDGFTSKSLGLGMDADWIDEDELDEDELEDAGSSFIVFRPGYHEEEQARLRAAGLDPYADD